MTTTEQDFKVSVVPGASGIRARLAIKAAGQIGADMLAHLDGPSGASVSSSDEAYIAIAAVEAHVAIASALLDVADAIRSLKSPTP